MSLYTIATYQPACINSGYSFIPTSLINNSLSPRSLKTASSACESASACADEDADAGAGVTVFFFDFFFCCDCYFYPSVPNTPSEKKAKTYHKLSIIRKIDLLFNLGNDSAKLLVRHPLSRSLKKRSFPLSVGSGEVREFLLQAS